MIARPSITKLRVAGFGKEPAELDFGPGLTLVTGLSNTGKSHVVECIDYGLAAGAPPREIPEARGYQHLALELETDGVRYTIGRALNDQENAIIFEGPLDEWDGATGHEVKVKIATGDPSSTLSGWLLALSGFDPDTPVVRNQRGQSQLLSFRNVVPLVLIKEPDVISTDSPLLPPAAVQQTAARSVFRVVLTGQSPTEDIASLREAHELREEAAQRAALLEKMITELRQEISDAELNRPDLEQELARIDAELAEVSETVTESGKRVRNLMRLRNDALSDADRAQRKMADLQALSERFSLLGRHYDADVRRLEFVIEGGHFFQQLSASHCPTCGRTLGAHDGCHPESADLVHVERSSRAEIQKLLPRMADLAKAIDDAAREMRAARARFERRSAHAVDYDKEIKQVANPTAHAARARVQAITRRRREVEEELLRFRELDRYVSARHEAATTAERKLARYRPEQDLSALKRLSAEVRSLLVDWKLPMKADVYFSTETDDLVIDGKDRRANGKGVRAVTHAAFTIGLMRYCLSAGTPHPGFVVIDTPLRHYRGPTDDVEDLERSRDLHVAILRSLASSPSPGQSIIMENEDPPAVIIGRAAIHEFTGSDGVGRRGFYPVA
jgi:predicted  nucleic acid-binding Zn-ribbon protein